MPDSVTDGRSTVQRNGEGFPLDKRTHSEKLQDIRSAYISCGGSNPAATLVALLDLLIDKERA